MARDLAARALPVAFVLALSMPGITQGDWRVDIGWYSAIGLQGWRTGSLWTLWAEPGVAYFNKPPLVLWIHGLVLWVLGPSLWAARIPSILAACAAVLATGEVARVWASAAWGGEESRRVGAGRLAALVAGVVLATTPEFVRRTREVSMDLWMIAFVMLAAWMVVGGRGWRSAASGGAMLGLALLCKPLVALGAWPILAWWSARRGGGGGWKPTAGRWAAMSLTMAAVALPWHASMAWTHGGAFVDRYFGAEVGARAAGQLVDPERASRDAWFHVGLLGRTYWPWLPALAWGAWRVLALARGRGGAFGTARTRGEAWGLAAAWGWSLAWIVGASLFEDRRPRYLMPAYPGLALVIAMVAAAGLRAGRRAQIERALRLAAVGAIVAAGALALAPVRFHRPPDAQWGELFAWMDREGVEDVWGGGLQGPRAARLYLETGRWSIATHDAWGRRIADPPRGAWVLYHDRDGRAPGPGEAVAFESGRLRVTRLEADEWRPVDAPDPGE